MNWAAMVMKRVWSVMKNVLAVAGEALQMAIFYTAMLLYTLSSPVLYLGCLTTVVVWTIVNRVLQRRENHDLYLLHLQRNIYWYFCFLMLRQISC